VEKTIDSFFLFSQSLCIFTNANEKFINVFVKAFIKLDSRKPQLGKSSYRLKKFHATTGLIQMLLALAHQIISA